MKILTWLKGLIKGRAQAVAPAPAEAQAGQVVPPMNTPPPEEKPNLEPKVAQGRVKQDEHAQRLAFPSKRRRKRLKAARQKAERRARGMAQEAAALERKRLKAQEGFRENA